MSDKGIHCSWCQAACDGEYCSDNCRKQWVRFMSNRAESAKANRALIEAHLEAAAMEAIAAGESDRVIPLSRELRYLRKLEPAQNADESGALSAFENALKS